MLKILFLWLVFPYHLPNSMLDNPSLSVAAAIAEQMEDPKQAVSLSVNVQVITPGQWLISSKAR